jgi:uncharacterized membrane protein YozB (DUF420 family)
MLDIQNLPTLNALLNATSATLLVAGYLFIRRRNIAAHRACMLGAVIASAAFFVSYAIYHAHAGATKFAGTGWVRPVYFAILISHTVLAAVIVPMALVTLVRALQRFCPPSCHRPMDIPSLALCLGHGCPHLPDALPLVSVPMKTGQRSEGVNGDSHDRDGH